MRATLTVLLAASLLAGCSAASEPSSAPASSAAPTAEPPTPAAPTPSPVASPVPTATIAPTATPRPLPTLKPLASILEGSVPKATQRQAAAAIKKLLAAHPEAAAAELAPMFSNETIKEFASPCPDWDVYAEQEPDVALGQCQGTFLALYYGYQLTGDEEFLDAARLVLGAARRDYPAKIYEKLLGHLERQSEHILNEWPSPPPSS